MEPNPAHSSSQPLARAVMPLWRPGAMPSLYGENVGSAPGSGL